MIKALSILLILVFAFHPEINAQRLTDVPGKTVYWRISPSTLFGYAVGPNRIYTASPSIVKLDNGDYLLSFNLFGTDMSPAAEVSGTTYIYKSSDKGNTWSVLTTPPLNDMKRGSLFVKDRVVYLWGFKAAPGQIVIRKSEDNGLTWSAATELSTDTRGGTPFNPVIMPDNSGAQRFWFPVGGKRLISGKADAALIMNKSNWSKEGSNAGTDIQPGFGTGVTVDVFSEAQIVHSPNTGLVVMPKIEMSGVKPPYFSYTVLLRKAPDSNNSLLDATLDDWVALPGAEKKFAASYDSVSGKFFVLSNPVLPAHETNSKWTWQLIRNTAALISSRDLLHWDVEQLFLYSKNIDYEGFQYLNFDFDGDDMIIASRTAFDLSDEPGISNKPPRGHDSNMITFHTIKNFRNVTPVFFLSYNGNQVLRHEQTQHAAAPLGSFVNGVLFDGKALGTINGLAQDVDGDVYVSEKEGRILRFDALGNFREIVSVSPVTLRQSDKLFINPPAFGERNYTKSGSGNWADLSNWFYWGRPDTDYEIANLGSAITSTSILTLDKQYSMKGIRFLSTNSYKLSGQGGILLKNASGNGILEIKQGNHDISVALSLENTTDLFVAENAGITLNAPVKLNGNTLSKTGSGRFVINNQLIMNGGRLLSDGLSPILFTTSANVILNGTLHFTPDPMLSLNNGAIIQLIEGIENVSGVFTDLVLPQLKEGLRWDVTTLYADGRVRVTDQAETSVSVLKASNSCVKVFPNPFSDELTLEVVGNQNVDCSIYSIDGKLISKNTVADKLKLKTNHLMAGIYFMKSENGELSNLIKLFKQ